MRKTIEVAFAEKNDITFILEHIETDDGEPVQTSVVGWHYGEPSEDTHEYIGKLTATYEL
jgi:hypothetical protein